MLLDELRIGARHFQLPQVHAAGIRHIGHRQHHPQHVSPAMRQLKRPQRAPDQPGQQLRALPPCELYQKNKGGDLCPVLPGGPMPPGTVLAATRTPPPLHISQPGTDLACGQAAQRDS